MYVSELKQQQEKQKIVLIKLKIRNSLQFINGHDKIKLIKYLNLSLASLQSPHGCER